MKTPRVTWPTQRDQVLDPADPTRDFLTDIRSSWLTTTPSQPEDATSATRRSSRSPFRIDPVHIARSVIASIQRRVTLLGRGLTGGLRSTVPGTSMLAFLASVLVIGGLGYVVVVNCILDPATVSNAAQSDSAPATAPAKESPVAAFFGLSSQSTDAKDAASGEAVPPPAPGHAVEIDTNAVAAISRSAEVSEQKAEIAIHPPIVSDAAGTIAHTAPGPGTLGLRQVEQSAPTANTATVATTPALQRRADAPQIRASPVEAVRDRDSAQQRDVAPASYRAETAHMSTPASISTPIATRVTAADVTSTAARAVTAVSEPPGVPAATLVHGSATSSAPAVAHLSTATDSAAATKMHPAGSSGERQILVSRPISNGAATYELEFSGAGAKSGQPVRLVITATALQFLPEVADEPGAFSIPLASITSLQTGNAVNAGGSPTLTIHYRDARNADKQILFGDHAPVASRASAPALQIPSQLVAMRDAILAAKARAIHTAMKPAFH